MNILVNGLGNIGTTLLGCLTQYKNDLGIGKIYALKNIIQSWNSVELDILQSMNVEIVCKNDQPKKYKNVKDIIESIDYIFDCTANGFGMKNKIWYQSLKNLKGCSAQGSEKGFGIPFMTGINDGDINSHKFVHIVSCNTHAIAALLKTFSGENLENLEAADCVVVRRCEDIGNHSRLVTANVISRHLNPLLGTHHAIDVIDLYETIGLQPLITSSDITTPSQLMHGLRFNICLKKPISFDIEQMIKQNPFVSITQKFDSNVIFELGRRYGPMGRIYSHIIIASNNLLIHKNKIIGWAFVPQEGCTILSTLHAYLLQTQSDKAHEIMQGIVEKMIRYQW